MSLASKSQSLKIFEKLKSKPANKVRHLYPFPLKEMADPDQSR